MFRRMIIAAALILPVTVLAADPAPNDAQIAHIAYTAGVLDVTAATQALSKATAPDVKAFAEEMARDLPGTPLRGYHRPRHGQDRIRRRCAGPARPGLTGQRAYMSPRTPSQTSLLPTITITR
jgi:hypothetical protein